jgi:hypothetical protein
MAHLRKYWLIVGAFLVLIALIVVVASFAGPPGRAVPEFSVRTPRVGDWFCYQYGDKLMADICHRVDAAGNAFFFRDAYEVNGCFRSSRDMPHARESLAANFGLAEQLVETSDGRVAKKTVAIGDREVEVYVVTGAFPGELFRDDSMAGSEVSEAWLSDQLGFHGIVMFRGAEGSSAAFSLRPVAFGNYFDDAEKDGGVPFRFDAIRAGDWTIGYLVRDYEDRTETEWIRETALRFENGADGPVLHYSVEKLDERRNVLERSEKTMSRQAAFRRHARRSVMWRMNGSLSTDVVEVHGRRLNVVRGGYNNGSEILTSAEVGVVRDVSSLAFLYESRDDGGCGEVEAVETYELVEFGGAD